jgi:hypothetical protein
MESLQKIIYLKKGGYDCTEEESAIIKGLLKDFITLFPIEYSEAITELEENAKL